MAVFDPALSEGRSVALVAPDGSLDWWCLPNLDSAPLFDRLLNAPAGGCFSISSVAEAHAVLGEVDQARELMREVLAASLNGVGLMTEMRDPRDGAALGNFPQSLSHLTMVHAALILGEPESEA
ncbi:MAG: DUF5911 domain-containing protein [Pseudomonas oryzihabitans]